MLMAMDRIAEYVHGLSFTQFIEDNKTVDAVVRNFEVIGEASAKLPNELKMEYREIPWKEMYLLRNKVSHEYFGIDYEILWDVAINYLPENRKQIEALLHQ
jgi:uncharacterized protein with HEPN domain